MNWLTPRLLVATLDVGRVKNKRNKLLNSHLWKRITNNIISIRFFNSNSLIITTRPLKSSGFILLNGKIVPLHKGTRCLHRRGITILFSKNFSAFLRDNNFFVFVHYRTHSLFLRSNFAP